MKKENKNTEKVEIRFTEEDIEKTHLEEEDGNLFMVVTLKDKRILEAPYKKEIWNVLKEFFKKDDC